MKQILVVDEDSNNLQIVKNRLTKEGYRVCAKHCIDDMERKRLGEYDLILTELTDAGCQEYGFITRLKERAACPVIIFSARTGERDIIESILAGADDYVVKPLRMQELTARVKVALQKKHICRQEMQIGEYLFLPADYSVEVRGKTVGLTRSEFRLCRVLAKNPGIIFSKERIYECLYEIDSDAQLRTITEYIYSVRKKFKETGMNPIKTVWGSGYRWETVE